MNTDANDDTSQEWKKKRGFVPTIVGAGLIGLAFLSTGRSSTNPVSLAASNNVIRDFEVDVVGLSTGSVNDCRLHPELAGSYKQCDADPAPWTGPTSCCCENQECKGQDYYKGCVPIPSPPVSGGAAMTHYWDGCRPSCAVTGVTPACDSTGEHPITGAVPGSICDAGTPNGPATCKSQYPQIIGGVLYGYAAQSGATAADINCGVCYKLTINGRGGVSSAIVQVTNAGDSQTGNFDLLVPGGGLGENTIGVSQYAGWNVCTNNGGPCECGSSVSRNSECTPYGGFNHESYCDSAFPGDALASKACHEVLWNIFPQMGCNQDDGYVPNMDISNSEEVTCPSFFD